jgi:hypothetical protein
MSLLPVPLSKLLNRWSSEEEAAIRQMVEEMRAIRAGRQKDGEIEGYGRSRLIEAKFSLLAAAPMSLVLVAAKLGWPRLVATVVLCLALLWVAIVLGICFSAMWRGLRNARTRER